MYSFDLLLAEHGAPVLAGIKTANLITCRRAWYPDLPELLKTYQAVFHDRGVRFRILCACDYRFLLLIYRPERLLNDLASQEARALLMQNGYPMEEGLDALLEHLSERIMTNREFPHEIGLFLSYPPEDVLGFICNRACNHKCVGCWKVYGDEQTAKNIFEKYEMCSKIYSRQWQQGKSIEQLTVAG